VISHGVRLAVYEWGDPGDPPLLLAHGGFDFAGTFDVFAPLLARGGYRVVSWDHRGHGDSEHTALYSWAADLRDALAVLDSVSKRPVPVVGHSKGGSILLELCEARPHRVTRFVNIDGLPSLRRHPDVSDHEQGASFEREMAGWLDHRRRAASLARKPGSLDELARRRHRMNPRLALEWLRYLVTIGARRDPDGWRWKIDPSMRFGGFGPWRSHWALERLPGLSAPMLGMLGLVREEMGWGTTPESLERYLPPSSRLLAFEDSGHFVHIEHPERTAQLVLEFLS
jgi:pimeloyl-ACP methyl ester carboxylesterase